MGAQRGVFNTLTPASAARGCWAATYSCAGCSPSKDSWPRGQVGADTQLVLCRLSHLPCLETESAQRGCLGQPHPVCCARSFIHWFIGFQTVFSHPNGLLGRLAVNPTDNSQAVLVERGQGAVLPRARGQARSGIWKAWNGEDGMVEKRMSEHGSGTSQGWGLGCIKEE